MLGIDISNNNGQVDFWRVKSYGVECVYIKATEGKTFKDPYMEDNYRGAIVQDLKVGFYHFLVGSSEPEEQATSFYNAIKDKTSHLKPCLDVEKTGFDIMDYVSRFISTFESLCNMDLCIYTGPYFANKNLDSSLSKYPCWIAHYGVNKPMATTVWGDNYAGHQYTENGSVDGVNGRVDMNNFNELILLENEIKLGWNKDNKGWKYYTDLENEYYYKDQWKEIENEWYCFDENGYAKSCAFDKYKEKWYYLNADCKMVKSEWVKYKEKWYYLSDDGSMITGWFKEKGSTYYLDEEGAMLTGWVEVDTYWYYFNSSGKMVTGSMVDGYEIDSKGISTRI